MLQRQNLSFNTTQEPCDGREDYQTVDEVPTRAAGEIYGVNPFPKRKCDYPNDIGNCDE